MDNASGKRRLRKVLYVYIAVILALLFCSKTIYTFSLPKVTVVMPQAGRLNKKIETHGVIQFAELIDICANNAGRIDELLIHEGDVVSPGMAIAWLAAPEPDAAAVARIHNRLAGLEFSKTDIQGKLAALAADSSALLPYKDAATDAKTALGRAQADYDAAALYFQNSSGGSAEDAQAAANAERELGRRKSALQNAKDELAQIENDNGKSFDDYDYLLAIETAETNLERRQDDLAKAEEALTDAKDASRNFDEYEYRKAVDAAASAYEQSVDLLEDAAGKHENAENYYDAVLSNSDDEEAIARAEQAMNAALSAMQDAERDADAAADALRTAEDDLTYAGDKFQSNSATAEEQAIEAAEDDVKQAEQAVADAEQELAAAREALDRAASAFATQQAEDKEEERETAEQNVAAAQTAVEDAAYAYSNAVSGLEHAGEDALHALETAGNTLTDARTALDRANRSLAIAAAKQLETIQDERKAYNLELNRLALDIELAGIDLLEAQPPQASYDDLTADYGGIILSVDKRTGQYASTGERVAVAGVADGGFVCEVTVPEKDARFIEIGDTAAVRQSGSDDATDATVAAVTLEGDLLRLKLILESEELNGGAYVSVTFAQQSVEYETLVPTEAVVSDPVSSYVWVLASKEGALGIEYYTRKVRVLIADKDGFYTAIATGLEPYQPVVLTYDKEPVVNGRVSRME